MSELKIPEDLRECYEACLAVERAKCGEDCVDAETEIILIERIALLEAQVVQLKAELASTEESLEAQQAKYDGCPHKPIERIGGDLCDTCGCSLDRIGDVCCLHAPALDKARAQVARLSAEVSDEEWYFFEVRKGQTRDAIDALLAARLSDKEQPK